MDRNDNDDDTIPGVYDDYGGDGSFGLNWQRIITCKRDVIFIVGRIHESTSAFGHFSLGREGGRLSAPYADVLAFNYYSIV